MGTLPYLTFSLNGSLCGIDALLVQEVFFLPELTPVPETPDLIAGIVNFRGKILPVIDLNLRLGRSRQPYQISDCVIAIQWQDTQLGMIASQVHQVQLIDSGLITPPIQYVRDFQTANPLVAGVARIDTDLILLLNSENLLKTSQAIEQWFAGELPSMPIDQASCSMEKHDAPATANAGSRKSFGDGRKA